MKEIKEIHNKKYKYIFLDIFDTIVSRKVQPEYTKKIWANKIIKKLALNISMLELYKKRNEVEKKLGQQAFNNNNDWEFKYIDLVDELYNYLHPTISLKKFQQLAIKTEIEVESSVLIPEKNLLKELAQAKKENKKIYCISDMYLSKEMIKKIFTNLNIIDLFTDFYISCEYMKNKKTGSLYDIVLKKLNVSSENCIMIGDNYSSDYEIPKSKGLTAIFLDKTTTYQKYDQFINENNENKILEKFLTLTKTKTNRFEHTIFSLYLFIEKLYYQLLNDNLDEVFFLSREGEFLKKLFDSYVNKIYGKKIKSHYIIASRKSTYLPSLKPLKEENFSVLLQQYVYINLEEFLASLNFSKEEQTSILESFSHDLKNISQKEIAKFKETEKKELQALINKKYDTKIIYLYESKILKYLKLNKKFQEIYETNRKNQNTLFKKYIKSLTKEKKICLVDIGWNGSIQDNIEKILGPDYQVKGYLLGLIRRDMKNSANKKGLIFYNTPKKSKNFNLYFENRTIYEILLGASHGSANKYIEKNNKVEVLTFEKEEEHNLYINLISKIQDSMFQIFEKLLEILPNGYYDNIQLNKLINKIHFQMIFEPTQEQLQFFNKIYHYENFGVFEFSKFNLKKKLNIKYYLKENIKYFVRNKSFFYDAFWPTLKLVNEKLYLQRFLYITKNKIKLKLKGVF